MRNWETFTRRMIPLTKEPSVTINKRGTFTLNKAAHVAMGEPDYTELLFDHEQRLIGVRKVDDTVRHAYRVVARSGSDGPFFVNAAAFCKYYDIDTSTTRRWTPTFDDGVLVVDLNGKSLEVSRNGSGAKDAAGSRNG